MTYTVENKQQLTYTTQELVLWAVERETTLLVLSDPKHNVHIEVKQLTKGLVSAFLYLDGKLVELFQLLPSIDKDAEQRVKEWAVDTFKQWTVKR